MQVSVLAGKDIMIDEFFPHDIPEYLERATTVANNPVAVANWFHLVISAVCKCEYLVIYVCLMDCCSRLLRRCLDTKEMGFSPQVSLAH